MEMLEKKEEIYENLIHISDKNGPKAEPESFNRRLFYDVPRILTVVHHQDPESTEKNVTDVSYCLQHVSELLL